MKTLQNWILFWGLLIFVQTGRADYSLVYQTNGDSVSVIGFTGTPVIVNIPSNYNGYPVTEIGEGAFYDCSSLVSVTVPEGVVSIQESAFDTCSNLVTITLPDSLQNVGRYAFILCESLPDVTIPKNVTQLAVEQFEYCLSMTNITILGPINQIGDFCFYYCTNLPTVHLSDTLGDIGYGAFWGCSNLGAIAIPGSVTNLEEGAFFECGGLTNVLLSNGLTQIPPIAFDICTNLRRITVPDTVTFIGAYAFGLCSNLTNVVVGRGLTNFSSSAFFGCPLLRSVFFTGDAPDFVDDWDYVGGPFDGDSVATAYYLPGTSGWDAFATNVSVPVVLWNPTIQTSDGFFGISSNHFRFTVTGTPDIPITIRATTNLATGPWMTLQNCTLTNGSIQFTDPATTTASSRFYSIKFPDIN